MLIMSHSIAWSVHQLWHENNATHRTRSFKIVLTSLFIFDCFIAFSSILPDFIALIYNITKQKNFVQRTSNKCYTEYFSKFVFVFFNLLKSIIVQAKLSFTSQSKMNNSK